MKEEYGALAGEVRVGDLVDDQQHWMQVTGRLRFSERNEFDERAVVDAATVLGGVTPPK